MKKIAGLMILISVLLTPSCVKIECNEADYGSSRPVKETGPVVSQERVFSDFTAVSSQLGADVNIFESDDNYIVISAQQNLLPYIKTNVKSGELRIFTSNENIQTDKTITIDVYTSVMKKFTLAGAGNIISDLPVNKIILSGAGNFRCKGEVENLDVLLSGVGNIDLLDMSARNAKVSILGSGVVKVFATDNLDVSIMGIGKVYYSGYPKVSKIVLGIGEVIDNN